MIRLIEEKDEKIICDWYNWYIANGVETFETEQLSYAEFSNRIHNILKKYPWIVLEEEGKIVGYAYLSAFNERTAYNWTCDLAIYLDPKQKGNGYGSKLMKAIIDLAKRDGYKKMTSIITEGNLASEHIHEKFGFVKKAFFEDVGYKNGKWLGVAFYQLSLNPKDEDPKQPKNLNLKYD